MFLPSLFDKEIWIVALSFFQRRKEQAPTFLSLKKLSAPPFWQPKKLLAPLFLNQARVPYRYGPLYGTFPIWKALNIQYCHSIFKLGVLGDFLKSLFTLFNNVVDCSGFEFSEKSFPSKL